MHSNYEVYPSYFDEPFDCKESYCETCTFDCWKHDEGDDV